MPRRQRSCGASRVMSAPWKRMVPASARTSPPIRLKTVVLPAPLGPMMPSTSRTPTVRETPSAARTAPNALETRSSARTSVTGTSAGRAGSGRSAEQLQLAAGGHLGGGAVVDHHQLVLVLLATHPLPSDQRRPRHVLDGALAPGHRTHDGAQVGGDEGVADGRLVRGLLGALEGVDGHL